MSSPPIVDMRGRMCPIPVIELALALRDHAEVTLLADDPAAAVDIPAWCRMRGATLVSVTEVAAQTEVPDVAETPGATGGARSYVVRRG